MHCPDEGLDKFEEISYLLKHKDRIDMSEFIRSDGDKDYAKPNDDIRELT